MNIKKLTNQIREADNIDDVKQIVDCLVDILQKIPDVVRCEDCSRATADPYGGYWCDGRWRSKEDFCSYAKKRLAMNDKDPVEE